MPAFPTTRSFTGLNNVTDPLRLGLAALVQADNINITETGAIEKRTGYSLALLGAMTGAYATVDQQRLYFVDAGSLKAMTGRTSAVTIKTGLTATQPMAWTEINRTVYFTNGVDSGFIEPDNSVGAWAWPVPAMPRLSASTGRLDAGLYRVCFTYTLPDGSMTGAGMADELVLSEKSALQIQDIPQLPGCKTNVYIAPANSTVFQYAGSPTGATTGWNSAPDALGADLLAGLHSPLPQGITCIAAWRSRIYAAQHFGSAGQSVVWFSQPLGFHLFALDTDFFMVPGQITFLGATTEALIVGTDSRIYAYDGNTLVVLAEYGAPAGQHTAPDGGRLLFWTHRGLCAALPFANLTSARVSFAPGAKAGGALIEQDGQRRYVACVQPNGQAAYNAHF